MSATMPPESATAPHLGGLFLSSLTKLSSVQPGERVLCVGGDGDTALTAAARAGDQGEVLVLEPDATRLASLLRTATERGITTMRGEQSDGSVLPGSDSYWDVALCHLGMPTLPDASAMLRESIRVLRPVGRIGVSVWGERARCPLITVLLDALAPHVPAAAALDRRLFRFSPPGVLAVTLADAGYQDAVPERLTEWPTFESVDAYWSVMAAEPVFAPLVAALTDEQRTAARATIESKTRFYKRGTGLELKVEGVILAAVK